MNCTTYHYDQQRTGLFVSNDFLTGRGKYFQVQLPYRPFPRSPNDGPTSSPVSVRAAPLFVENWTFRSGPHAGQTHNVVFIASSDNCVYAYAEDQLLAQSTVPLWYRCLGRPSPTRCSNIEPPIGICSTPVIDLANERMFVICLIDDGGSTGHCTGADGTRYSFGNAAYWIFSLDINTGSMIESGMLHDPGAVGRQSFDANVQDQRGALNLVAGRIYATFADMFALDLCDYIGWVVSINVDNLLDQWFFQTTSSVTGGGIWGQGGAAAAPDDTLYVATGNSPDQAYDFGNFSVDCPRSPRYSGDRYWSAFPPGLYPAGIGDYFMAVIRLGTNWFGSPPTPFLVPLDWYQPSATGQPSLKELNHDDLDIGGSSPIVLPPIGGMNLLVVSGKDGSVYLLDRTNLGHGGRQLAR